MYKELIIVLTWMVLCVSCRPTAQNKPTQQVPTSDQALFIDSATDSHQDSFVVEPTYTLPLRGGVRFKLEELIQISTQLQQEQDMKTYFEKFVAISKELNEDLAIGYKNCKNDSIKKCFNVSVDTLCSRMCFATYTKASKKNSGYISLQVDSLLSFCKSTKGKSDDLFFTSLKLIYGSQYRVGLSACYLQMNAENKLVSMMGDYSNTQCLQNIQAGINRKDLFVKNYEEEEQNLRDHLYETRFAWSKERVLAEYNMILQKANHPSYEINRIQQRIQDIETEATQFTFNAQ